MTTDEQVKKRILSEYFVIKGDAVTIHQKKREAEIAISKIADLSQVIVIKGKSIPVNTKTIVSLGNQGDEEDDSPVEAVD